MPNRHQPVTHQRLGPREQGVGALGQLGKVGPNNRVLVRARTPSRRLLSRRSRDSAAARPRPAEVSARSRDCSRPCSRSSMPAESRGRDRRRKARSEPADYLRIGWVPITAVDHIPARTAPPSRPFAAVSIQVASIALWVSPAGLARSEGCERYPIRIRMHKLQRRSPDSGVSKWVRQEEGGRTTTGSSPSNAPALPAKTITSRSDKPCQIVARHACTPISLASIRSTLVAEHELA